MTQSKYQTNFIIQQFNIHKFKKMIEVFLNLINNFQTYLASEEYTIKLTSNYEMRVGGNLKPTTSTVETFLYSKYDTDEKKQQLLLKYKVAFNSLNEMERKIFTETFINNATNDEMADKFYICLNKVTFIKKSAIVKFSLRLGFDHFVNSF